MNEKNIILYLAMALTVAFVSCVAIGIGYASRAAFVACVPVGIAAWLCAVRSG